MVNKRYLDAQELLEDSFRLGAMIACSGFRPNYIVAIWRGGAPVGIAVQEMLAAAGMETDHIAIRTSSYSSTIDQRSRQTRVHGLSYLVDRIEVNDRLLLVDDVYDTGLTMQEIIAKLKRKARRNAPDQIRIAVPWYKPSRNQTGRMPDYYLHETDDWLKFPHSLEGLSEQEIQTHRPQIWDIVKGPRNEM